MAANLVIITNITYVCPPPSERLSFRLHPGLYFVRVFGFKIGIVPGIPCCHKEEPGFSFIHSFHPSVPVFSFHILSFEVGHTGNGIRSMHFSLSLSLLMLRPSYPFLSLTGLPILIGWRGKGYFRERERERLFWRARANMQIMSLAQCRCSPGPIEFLSEAVSLSRRADSSCPESM